MKGYTQIYTGNGKGKSTAAFGLAIRAAGAGLKVFIGQFVKKMEYSEVKSLRKLEIEIHQYGSGCFIKKNPAQKDIDLAREGYNEVYNLIKKGAYDLVILDELNIALYYRLITEEEALDLVREKPDSLELVITGRYAPEKLVAAADLVTEMKEIKHYYNEGVSARDGIER